MARKEQQQNILNAPNVQPVANPVSTFYVPRMDEPAKPLQGESGLAQLAQALQSFKSPLAQLGALKQEEEIQQKILERDEFIRQGSILRSKNQMDVDAAISKGILQPQDNPWLIYGWRQADTQVKAQQFQAQLTEEVNQALLSEQPVNIQEVLQKRYSEFLTSVEGVDSRILAEVIPQINGTMGNLQSQYSAQMPKIIYNKNLQAQEQALNGRVSAALQAADARVKAVTETYQAQLSSANQALSSAPVTVKLGGRDVQIPTLVPTLTKDEVKLVQLAQQRKAELPPDVLKKIVDHAQARIAAGKSPFIDAKEMAPSLAKVRLDAIKQGDAELTNLYQAHVNDTTTAISLSDRTKNVKNSLIANADLADRPELLLKAREIKVGNGSLWDLFPDDFTKAYEQVVNDKRQAMERADEERQKQDKEKTRNYYFSTLMPLLESNPRANLVDLMRKNQGNIPVMEAIEKAMRVQRYFTQPGGAPEDQQVLAEAIRRAYAGDEAGLDALFSGRPTGARPVTQARLREQARKHAEANQDDNYRAIKSSADRYFKTRTPDLYVPEERMRRYGPRVQKVLDNAEDIVRVTMVERWRNKNPMSLKEAQALYESIVKPKVRQMMERKKKTQSNIGRGMTGGRR